MYENASTDEIMTICTKLKPFVQSNKVGFLKRTFSNKYGTYFASAF